MTLLVQLLPSLVEKSRYPRRRMAALLLIIFLGQEKVICLMFVVDRVRAPCYNNSRKG